VFAAARESSLLQLVQRFLADDSLASSSLIFTVEVLLPGSVFDVGRESSLLRLALSVIVDDILAPLSPALSLLAENSVL